MRPTKLDIDPANLDADGLAAANDSSGATLALDAALTLGGTFTSADGLGRQVAITDTSTKNQAAATFTIIGTNANGEAITDDVVGPASGATVLSAKQFLTITSITIDTPVATSTVNVGTTQIIESKTIPVNWMENVGCTVAIMGAIGTFQVDIEETFDDILANGVDSANFWEKQTDKSADGAFGMTARATGVRVNFDSYTSGAEFQLHVLSAITQ